LIILLKNKMKNNNKYSNDTRISQYFRPFDAGLVFRINNKYKDFKFIEDLNENYNKEFRAPIKEIFKDIRKVIIKI